MASKFWKKWHIMIKIVPFIIVIVFIKLLLHRLGFEIISLNALFTSVVAATTFLIGFLITGVISDYKESEKIPGELSSSLKVLHDEAEILYLNKKSEEATEFIIYLKEFINSLHDWLYKKERTQHLQEKLNKMNIYFARFEKDMQSGFISRMKQEQNNIRKYIIRIHCIRETSFIETAYAIVELLAFFLIVALSLLKLEPFYEAIFFVVIVSFLVLYMIFLIKDLDNPFDYAEYGENGNEISLKPLNDLMDILKMKGKR